MSTLDLLLHGFGVAFQPINLLMAFIGSLLGTAIGVLPGIGPALTIALLMPVTTSLEPASAFIMFAGILYGAMYGGSTTSILLNTPGESGSMMTALEGNQMARRGRGAAALATAAIGSFVAGTIGTLALSFVAPAVSELAFIFGPEDYFALMVLSFTTISVVLGNSPLRGAIAVAVGLGLGVIGIDAQTGQSRLTFGSLDLLDGIPFTIVLVSLFAVGEIIYVASRGPERSSGMNPLSGGIWMTKEDWKRSWKPWLRGTALGFPIGVLPAGGSEIPTFLSYAVEKRLSKHPEEFGSGAIEGVAGPEAANNAAAAGILVPLLTLGLPTSATSAILLSAFQGYGLQPGPLLFVNNAELVWGLIASLYIGNFMLIVLNLPLAGMWVRLLMIPRPQLYAGIVIFALVGVWGLSTSWFDLLLMFSMGLLGYAMRLYDFPAAPVLIGLILGPMAEQQLRRALAISQGDPVALVSTPISATLLGLALCIVVLPPLLRTLARRPAGDDRYAASRPTP
ncbi:tripartite tricarboxylate transporter permease [Ancylobacter sp. Lp-2]|uniref:tripartite tricarboxylate transporter permease n=1 Tax=Ancylobacter sp. Lp-2 TaxID=2881339 RepID=UPI001E3910F8|nr:tripartite tricarboxylate transporter permease [Ancylobacter sp. Lp-2]MCB4769585.1 tripartite tricarboxylate transporter permease [Ancylobacter sp. Lp-2]